MTEQTIEVEGFPEGWKAVAFRKPLSDSEYVLIDGEARLAIFVNRYYEHLIIEKIKPREIRLVETKEENSKIGIHYQNQIFLSGKLCLDGQNKVWKEVKSDDQQKMGVSEGDGKGNDLSLNSDEPKLSLSVSECKGLFEGNQPTINKVKEFIKENP
jgi:hypothetical protein